MQECPKYVCSICQIKYHYDVEFLGVSFSGFSGKLLISILHLKFVNYFDFDSSEFERPIPLFSFNFLVYFYLLIVIFFLMLLMDMI